MIEFFGYHLRNLANFSGRESQKRFWLWGAFVLGLTFVMGAIVFMPRFTDAMNRMQRFAMEYPESATVESGPGHYSIQIDGHHPELMPDMDRFFYTLMGITAFVTVLIGAAAVRRLHDTGRRGWWLLLPVPFVTVGYTVAPDLFEQVVAGDAASFRLFVLLFFNNLIYMVMLAVVVIFLALPGRPDANRFGPPPAD